VTGIVVYDEIKFDRIRKIPLSKLHHAFPSVRFAQEHPPTIEQIQDSLKHEDDPKDVSLEMTLKPRGSESVNEFYAQVASFYVSAKRLTGQPVKMIQASAGVPKTTAARWVREARARHYLPPTTRGRT
jgi:hypothetical protein